MLGVFLFFWGVSAQAEPFLLDYKNSANQQAYQKLLINGEEYPAFGYIRNPVPLDEELNFKKLKEIILSKNINSIDGVIAELPDYMVNDNYIVVYRSRSLQKASPQSPRIITYVPTARFILSFNGGDPKVKGGNALELIQFNDQLSRFEFHEIIFDPNKKSPQFSETDPKKCLGCHQSPYRKNVDMRPNWEPYSTWPGVIGSNDGSFSSLKGSSHAKFFEKPEDAEFLLEQQNESEYLDQFIKQIAPTHPRYSKLGQFSLRAPLNLTQLLSTLNFQRVLRLMSEETPIFESHQEALEMLGRCLSYHSTTEGWQEGYTVATFDNLLEKHRQLAPNHYPLSYHETSKVNFSQRLSWIFESLGVDTSDWSMDLGSGGRFAFIERFGTPSHTDGTYAAQWKKKFSFSPLNCKALAEIATKKINGFFAHAPVWESNTPLITQISAPQILNRCSKCHIDTMSAPYLPFDDIKELKLRLHMPFKNHTLLDEIILRTSDIADISQQMPPDRRLNAIERTTLKTYLEDL